MAQMVLRQKYREETRQLGVHPDVQFAGGNMRSITNITAITTTPLPCPDIADGESCRQVDDVSVMRRIYASGVRATHSVPFPRCRCPLAADLASLIAAAVWFDVVRIHIRLDARCRKRHRTEFRHNVDAQRAGKLLLLAGFSVTVSTTLFAEDPGERSTKIARSWLDKSDETVVPSRS